MADCAAHHLGFLLELFVTDSRAHGHEPGPTVFPDPAGPTTAFVADDIDAAWSEIGRSHDDAVHHVPGLDPCGSLTQLANGGNTLDILPKFSAGMHCIQDTMTRFSVFQWSGIAPDHAFDLLESVLSRRVHIAAGNRRSCCGATIELVAADPADPTLPDSVGTALRALTPGRAIGSTDFPELASGWIAMPGVDIRIETHADLGGPVIAITFDDAVALISAPGAEHLSIRTTAVVAGTQQEPPGWEVVRTDVAAVPLAWESYRHDAECAA